MELTAKHFQDLKTEMAAIRNLLTEKHEPEILTSAEVMKLLRISRNSYNRMKDEGIIKVYMLRGKLYSKRSEIFQSLEEGKLN